MGKSTISMAIFNCFLYVHQRVIKVLNFQQFLELSLWVAGDQEAQQTIKTFKCDMPWQPLSAKTHPSSSGMAAWALSLFSKNPPGQSVLRFSMCCRHFLHLSLLVYYLWLLVFVGYLPINSSTIILFITSWNLSMVALPDARESSTSILVVKFPGHWARWYSLNIHLLIPEGTYPTNTNQPQITEPVNWAWRSCW